MQFKGKVLIVDDEQHIRKYLSLVLRKIGEPKIFEASNGSEAIESYNKIRPDLVLLDVNMPIMDGPSALEKIRAINPQALIIMLTSMATRSIVERCIELGAANFIRKDTPKEEIAKVLLDTLVSQTTGSDSDA